MSESASITTVPSTSAAPAKDGPEVKLQRRRRRRRILGSIFLILVVALVIARLMLPTYVRWYVNRTLDRNRLYDGRIGSISINLWRGKYSINEIKLLKTTGNVPVPFFSAKRMDLAIEWSALLHGKVKGTIVIQSPQLNFVEDKNDANSQTGAGGPWLGIIQSLFPFDINSVTLHDGSVHFRTYDRTPQVDVYLSEMECIVDDLSNIKNQTKPLVSTVVVHAMAMESGNLEMKVEFDPFSYRPTFQLALRLIGLDVLKTNDMAKAYGGFDFEGGWFDLVIELTAREGALEGDITPLFRNLKIFGRKDLEKNNPLNVFWQALVGGAEFVLQNQPRDQFGTRIPVTGNLDIPKPDLLATLGNVLRNAFIRAYLPRLQQPLADVDGIQFKPGTVTDPGAPSMMNP